MDLDLAECLKNRMAEIHDLKLEIRRLRAERDDYKDALQDAQKINALLRGNG